MSSFIQQGKVKLIRGDPVGYPLTTLVPYKISLNFNRQYKYPPMVTFDAIDLLYIKNLNITINSLTADFIYVTTDEREELKEIGWRAAEINNFKLPEPF